MVSIRSFLVSLVLLPSIWTLDVHNRTNGTFGTILGYASTTVEAYSNGDDSFIARSYYYLHGVYMGIKWQCVEYARRWLFVRKGCVFSSIEGAADMWTELTFVQRVVDGRCFNLTKYPNGSPTRPQNESLLIYPRSGTEMSYGHVAVIVDVLPNAIRVAEENYDSYFWIGNYSRQIPYSWRNGSYFIEDEYPILGWMVVEDRNQTKPLDQMTINSIVKLNQSSPSFICSNSAGNNLQWSFFLVVSTLISINKN